MSKLVGAEAGAETGELVDMNDTGSEESLSGSENGEEYSEPPSMPQRNEKPPRPVALRPGQMYFSSRFHVKLLKAQQERLGANSVGTRNKCRKSRPWVMVEILENGRALAMCSTTRERKTWIGVTEDTAGSFLPISPTISEFGRPVVNLAEDKRHIFTGSSLFFLEIQQEIKTEFLGDYIGSLTEEGLATLKDERKRWEDGGGVVPPVSHGKEEGNEEEDEDGDGDEDDVTEVEGEEGVVDDYKDIDGNGWTVVPHRKRSHSARGRGWRSNRSKGNCRESLGCGHPAGGRKTRI